MKSPTPDRKNLIPEFYSRVLSDAEKVEFEQAAGIEGLDNEISLLRMKISSLLKEQPDNIRLLMAADEILTRMVKVRYKMNQAQRNGLREGITNIIKDIAVPLGIAILKDR